MNNKTKIVLKKIKLKKEKETPKEISDNKDVKLIKKKIIPKLKVGNLSMSVLEKQKMNDLSHLFRNSQNSDIDIKWTLSLRNSENEYDMNPKEYERKLLRFKRIHPPSFFQKDIANYIKKRKERMNSCDEINLPKLQKYTDLFRRRLCDTHGTILNNRTLLNFELNLRNIHNMNKNNFNQNIGNINNSARLKENPKWDNSILRIKKDDLKIINYSMDNNIKKEDLWLKDKYMNRPYKILFKKIKFDLNRFIYKKIYIKDKDKAYNRLGDSYSLEPFNDTYDERDYTNLIYSLNPGDRTQQNLSFHFNLRKYNKNIK